MFYEKDTIYMTRSAFKSEIYRKPIFIDSNSNNHDENSYIKDFYDDAVIFVTGWFK